MVLLIVSAGSTQAQALVYHPNNPAFGGNTFNYQWMLSSAQAQDRLTDPTLKKTTATATKTSNQLSDLATSIQRQLLSRITNDLLKNQFGENSSLKEGTYKYGDFTVTIRNQYDGIYIRIVDNQGGETSIQVPYF
ncbi:Curli production assembly/transport component CsgF [Spirosoma linguale DSM 74]|uniref:Curli production assembly/transport component CsgF n=2 Tax=Spirosoma TaxID=107 RepID=D2QPP8_SPILD|nr:Curli production assembly/transport component CsgF [Spirosoma linguale DSM 74]